MREKIQMKKYIIVFLVIVILLFFFWFYFRIETVNIDGCHFYSEEQLKKRVLTGELEHNSIFLYIKYRYFRSNTIPFIQNITIERNSNHEITIQVYEKSLVACIRYMSEYIYFDKYGVVMETSVNRMKKLPYITGVDLNGFAMYTKVSVVDDSVFDTIYELSQIMQKYKIVVDKINFDTHKEVSLVSGTITVLLGKKKFYDEQFAALSSILPKAVATGKGGILDMKNYKEGKNVIFKQSN